MQPTWTPEELREARRKLGLSQTQMAKALGLSASGISAMERSVRPIERRTELAIQFLMAEAGLAPPK